MVLCKYFQQGTCRFGQYCKFEHNFSGNRNKTFEDEKNIVLMVAEDSLCAEKGGQWLLSCYGPLREQKCIPGMEDVSPDEVRWEMYQAQKNGNADQINAQFQQMCEAMKAKREALKNPTSAIVQLLEKIQSSETENSSFGNNSKLNKGNFAFGTPQLNIPNNNQTSSSVFGQKPFGVTNNPFGANNNYNMIQSSSSIFSRPTTFTSNSVFGGKPSFGSAPVFGNSSNTSTSIFGGVNKIAASAFGAGQNAPSFSGLASQGTSIFGGGATTTAHSGFGQSATFGANGNQVGAGFLKPPSTQPSVFGSAIPAQTSNVFGATSTGGQTSVFGSSTTSGSGLFGQSTTSSAAFGGAPVFGATSAFGVTPTQNGGANAGSSVFGGQPTFGATTVVSSSSNVFGASNTVTSSFGAIAAQTAQTTNTTPAAFGATTNTTGNASSGPFDAPMSTATGPFGGTLNTTVAQSPFGGGISSYSKGTSFGFATASSGAETNNSVFGTTSTTSSQSTFGGTGGFGGTQTTGSVFARPTATTTGSSNVFLNKNPQQSSGTSPFGAVSSAQPNSQGNNVEVAVTFTIDETAYSAEDVLTDDEKAAYRMNFFTEGKIPLNPPTKELS